MVSLKADKRKFSMGIFINCFVSSFTYPYSSRILDKNLSFWHKKTSSFKVEFWGKNEEKKDKKKIVKIFDFFDSDNFCGLLLRSPIPKDTSGMLGPWHLICFKYLSAWQLNQINWLGFGVHKSYYEFLAITVLVGMP